MSRVLLNLREATIVFVVSLALSYLLFAGSFTGPGVSVGAPLHSEPSSGVVVGYESLSPEEQTAFRQASGSNASAPQPSGGFPRADYIHLDGMYFPIEESAHITLTNTILGGLVGGLSIFGGVISSASIITIAGKWVVATRWGSWLQGSEVTPAQVGSAVFAISLISLLLTVPTGYTSLNVSKQPVEGVDTDDTTTIHITDLDQVEQQNIRSAISSGVERPIDEVTYAQVYQGGWKPLNQTVSDELRSARYIRTDGEVYAVTVQEHSVNPVGILAHTIMSIIAGVLAGAVRGVTGARLT